MDDKITIERETLQAALDALDHLGDCSDRDVSPEEWNVAKAEQACTSLRAALAAQPAEPVAWRLRIGDSDVWSFTETERDADFFGNQSGLRYVKEPLYAAQPAPVAVPQVADIFSAPKHYSHENSRYIWSDGWNACRSAMIAAAGDNT